MPEDSTTPISLTAFGNLLRPQLTGTRTVQARKPGAPAGVIHTYTQGHVDEIWLKLLQVEHGNERHTETAWRALIDRYRDQPAHPADPDYAP